MDSSRPRYANRPRGPQYLGDCRRVHRVVLHRKRIGRHTDLPYPLVVCPPRERPRARQRIPPPHAAVHGCGRRWSGRSGAMVSEEMQILGSAGEGSTACVQQQDGIWPRQCTLAIIPLLSFEVASATQVGRGSAMRHWNADRYCAHALGYRGSETLQRSRGKKLSSLAGSLPTCITTLPRAFIQP